MSVYKPVKSRFWQYDFVLKGRRFHGSTGQENRRAAERVERVYRLEAAEGRLGDAAALTLDQAMGRMWAEVWEGTRNADQVERRAETCLRLLGAQTRLCDIGTKEVAAAIQRRRRETFTRSKAEDAVRYPVAPATVNQDIVRTLRPVMNRAARTWEATGLKTIDWKSLLLTEPEPPIVWYPAADREAWRAQCDDTARLALDCLLTYGWRSGELHKPWTFDALGPEGEQGAPIGPQTIINGRKAGPLLTPLRPDHARELGARIGRAVAAGLGPTPWIELDQYGRLVAVSPAALTSRLHAAAGRAGVTAPGGVLRGARHHAITAVVSRSGNLKLGQAAGGHADIKSTMRYAHALTADLRTALGADLPRNNPEPVQAQEAEQPPEQRRSR